MKFFSLALTCLTLTPSLTFATAITYTVTGTVAAGTVAVDARVTFVTSQDQLLVTIRNQIVGASRDLQGIASVDFVLDNHLTAASIANRVGLTRTILSSTGNYMNGDSTGANLNLSDAAYNGLWSLKVSDPNAYNATTNPNGNGLANGISLSMFGGGNQKLTIMGAANSSNLYNSYGAPNAAFIKPSHNPYLFTDAQDVVFTLNFGLNSGVTSGTNIEGGGMRFFFGTDRTNFLNGSVSTPEPASELTALSGILFLAVKRMRSRNT